MADKTMKTLTIGSNIYEIVDEYARNKIDSVESIANQAAQTANKATDAIDELPDTFVTKINGKTGDVVIDIPNPPVTSVNGKTGDVVIDIPNPPVTSVNNMTGDVKIDIPVTSVNNKTGNVVIDVPVTSVNNMTGDVKIPVRTTYTTTIDVPIGESNWTFDETYVSYARTFNNVQNANPNYEMYVDCLTGSNFPILGARCNANGQVIIYMAYPPTVAQRITIMFKTEA